MRRLRLTSPALIGMFALMRRGDPAYGYSGPAYHCSDYAQTLGINDDIIQVREPGVEGHRV